MSALWQAGRVTPRGRLPGPAGRAVPALPPADRVDGPRRQRLPDRARAPVWRVRLAGRLRRACRQLRGGCEVTAPRPTTTTHAPGCDRPGWVLERYPRLVVARCGSCGAVELRDPDPDPGGDR